MECIEKLDYLDDYLDYFIERTAMSKRVYNEETQMEEYRKNIWLKSILESGIKEEEYEYAFYYFNEKGITVTGYSYALCGYFDNYKYIPHHEKKVYFTEEERIDTDEVKEEIKILKETKDEQERKELRDRIIRNNMLLINNIARKYSRITSIDYEELFEYGCIGLIEAIDKYDVNTKNRFSSYAVECIQGYILKSIPEVLGFKSRNIYYEMLKIKKELETEDIDEIASVLAEDNNLVTKEDRMHQLNIYNPLSIEEIDYIDVESPIETVEDHVFLEQAKKELLEYIDKYDSHGIMLKSFGLDDSEPKIDLEVGKEIGYSRQHVNCVKKRILSRMGNTNRIKELNRESSY